MNVQRDRGSEDNAEIWLRAADGGIRIILAELAESSGRANVLWSRAIDVLSTNPDQALTWLVELEIQLEHSVRPELEDTLKVVREGMARLDAELPEDTSVGSSPG